MAQLIAKKWWKQGFPYLMQNTKSTYSYNNVSCRLFSGLSSSDTFLNRSNNDYIDEIYKNWKKNPNSIHPSWSKYFMDLENTYFTRQSEISTSNFINNNDGNNDALGLSYLIRAYQVRGHEAANLDPLDLQKKKNIPELDIEMYGFKSSDLNRFIDIPKNFASGVTGFLEELTEGKNLTLGQIVKRLKETYCNHIGVEYMHILDTNKCNWIRTKVEHLNKVEETKAKKMHILERLTFSDTFERFLANKYNTTKRFGLDGAESLIPGLKSLVDRSTELGVEHIIMGMPHRGRLNVLSNVIRKPIQQIFKEFQGTHFDLDKYIEENEDWSGSGDVKYHLGTSYDRTYPDGRKVHLSLVANPSHLEAVDPVVVGKSRAKQYYLGNSKESVSKVMPLLLHGDAAFAGQGIVYETMHFSELENYATGGTIHVVVNNQVGFTTDPKQSRSSPHCTDVGKALNIPIFHVNGDDPLAVVKVFELAAEWRQKWHCDVIINLTCYRKFGHNEIDNPMFTQPIMYNKIPTMKSTLELYINDLVNKNVCTKEESDNIINKVYNFFSRTFEESKSWEESSKSDWLANQWESFKSPSQQSRIRKTGLDLNLLKNIGEKLCDIPKDFDIHRQLNKILETRNKTIETGDGIDWATAESLAWGSLLLEGNHVRISGQDVERGTFSHRHAVLHDQNNGKKYTPLNHLKEKTDPSSAIKNLKDESVQGEFIASNSSLSEFGVLGFELGYSLENPNALIMWEAQFGDFANGAQIIIDQFLSSGEDKWMRQSGLVMLLPHGYEGQGAEHSSCRVERYLQQSDDDPNIIPIMDEDNRMQIQQTNWQIVYCSTPAQYFHVLRRQIHRNFRKPLISVQPKHLLRLKQACSKLEDFGPGTKFQRLISDIKENELNKNDITKILFCTGKIYYELESERQDKNRNNIAIVRIEQFTPFPFDKVSNEIKKYPNAKIIWVQEEPQNMGFWTYIAPRMETTLIKLVNDFKRKPEYIGRVASAATATGYHTLHQAEQQEIIKKAFE